jgi:hypothetical protein
MLDFYKTKFERELKRRVDLDNSVNLPILVSSLVMGLNSYVIKEHTFNKMWDFTDTIIILLLLTSCILILISSYYIFLSINNLIKGFDYPNFDLMSKYREIEIFNKDCEEEDKINVEEMIKDKIVKYADESTIINDKRSESIFKARKFIIINFIATTINIIIITSLNLLK